MKVNLRFSNSDIYQIDQILLTDEDTREFRQMVGERLLQNLFNKILIQGKQIFIEQSWSGEK